MNNPLSGTDPTGYFIEGHNAAAIGAAIGCYFGQSSSCQAIEDLGAAAESDISGISAQMAGTASGVQALLEGGGAAASDIRTNGLSIEAVKTGVVRAMETTPIGIVGKGRRGIAGTGNGARASDPVADRSSSDGSKVGALEQRSKEVHGSLDPHAQRRRTTAVVTGVDPNTGETKTVVASSEPRLSPSQRQALQAGEVEATGKGHAEQKALAKANEMGLSDPAVAASRPVCASCQERARESGARVESPLKRTSSQSNSRPTGTPEIEVCRVEGRTGGCGK